jgi:serine/threonine protein phosphatase PrpC
MTVRIRVGTASDIGRARERNEDAYLASHPLYVVADGMGGHRGGREASRMAVDVLAEIGEEAPQDRLTEQIRRANEAVFERSSRERALAGMGTTVTAVMAGDNELHLAHVGDSRAYLLRDGKLRRLTQDHTLVDRMVREGKISEAEAHTHPQRSILTRALGVDQDVQVDEVSMDVRGGDRLLLCTDGLTGMVEEEEVRDVLQSSKDPQEAADRLVAAANAAGGLDNITVVVLDFEAEDEGAEAPAAIAEPVPAEPGKRRHARPRWKRAALWAGALVVAVVVAIVGVRLYVDSQWYVGVQNGHVAIFRGIPTTVLGFDLSSAVRETRLEAADAEKIELYRSLEDGISVGSRSEASARVDQIREDIAEQARQEKRRAGGNP